MTTLHAGRPHAVTREASTDYSATNDVVLVPES